MARIGQSPGAFTRRVIVLLEKASVELRALQFHGFLGKNSYGSALLAIHLFTALGSGNHIGNIAFEIVARKFEGLSRESL